MILNISAEFNRLIGKLHENAIPYEILAYAYDDGKPVLQVCCPDAAHSHIDAITLNWGLEVMSDELPDVSSPIDANEAFDLFDEYWGNFLNKIIEEEN